MAKGIRESKNIEKKLKKYIRILHFHSDYIATLTKQSAMTGAAFGADVAVGGDRSGLLLLCLGPPQGSMVTHC